MRIQPTVKALVSTACLLSSPFLFADSSLSFSFAPPPITSVSDSGERINKATFGYTSLEYESDDFNQEFTLLGANWLSKQDGQFFSLGVTTGEDDTGDVYLLGFTGQYGLEQALQQGALWSIAGGLSYLYTEFDSNDSYFETELITLQGTASIQQRFPVADRVGVTPYLLLTAVLLGTGTVDSNTVGGVDSSDIDIDPYLGFTLGFDVDFNGYSIAAMYQSADESSVTSVSFGFEF